MVVLNCINQMQCKKNVHAKKNCFTQISLQQQRLTCFHINLDFLVLDKWQVGNILDEVELEVIRVWANPIYLRAQVEEQMVFRRRHKVLFTHLEMKSPMILYIIS